MPIELSAAALAALALIIPYTSRSAASGPPGGPRQPVPALAGRGVHGGLTARRPPAGPAVAALEVERGQGRLTNGRARRGAAGQSATSPAAAVVGALSRGSPVSVIIAARYRDRRDRPDLMPVEPWAAPPGSLRWSAGTGPPSSSAASRARRGRLQGWAERLLLGGLLPPFGPVGGHALRYRLLLRGRHLPALPRRLGLGLAVGRGSCFRRRGRAPRRGARRRR